MRPGKTNFDATRAIKAAAEPYGLAGNFLSLFIAHGVGIGSNEPPYIGETLPGALEYEFEPGMVFAIEPLIGSKACAAAAACASRRWCWSPTAPPTSCPAPPSTTS